MLKSIFAVFKTIKIIKIIRKILFFIVTLPVWIYRYLISPFTPASCRHYPTCSQYFIESVRVHGAFKGVVFGIRRLSKCHPWGTSGIDPVPPKGYPIIKTKKMKMKNDEKED